MSLISSNFTRRQLGTAPALPDGYDDESSPFFIPQQLRELYPGALEQAHTKVNPDSLQQWLTATASWLAAGEIIAEDGPLPEAPERASQFTPLGSRIGVQEARDQWAQLAKERDVKINSRAQQLNATNYQFVLMVANHRAALVIAQEQHRAAEERRATDAANEARATCPICGTVAYTVEQGAPVKSRYRYPHVKPWSVPSRDLINSCTWCFEAVLEHDRAQRINEKTQLEAEGMLNIKSRAERVRALLASN